MYRRIAKIDCSCCASLLSATYRSFKILWQGRQAAIDSLPPISRLVGVVTTHVLCDHVGLLLAGKSKESGFGDVKLIGSLLFTAFHVSNSCCRAAFAWILAVRRLCKMWWWCNIYCSISYLCDLFCGWVTHGAMALHGYWPAWHLPYLQYKI